ncbi:MAG: response regulator [Vicinamibacterales bacterium]
MAPDRPLVTLRLPFALRTRRGGDATASPDTGQAAPEAPGAAPRGEGPAAVSSAVADRLADAADSPSIAPAHAPPAPAPTPEATGVDDAASTLVWLAFTSTLSARATTLEDAALAALEGRLDPAPRRRAARDTHKLATSLWLVGARDAARQAWEAAGLLDAGTLLGTANALRLSQIVEGLHGALRSLPPPEALSVAGRAHAPLLLVVDDDEALTRELPIEAAVRGWRARVVRHLFAPIEDAPAVIVLGPDCLGDTDAAARARLLAAFPAAALVALVPGSSIGERTAAHAVAAERTLCKPMAPAALVDEAADLLRRRQAAPGPLLVGVGDPVLRAAVRAQLAGLGPLVDVAPTSEALWSAVTQLRPELCVFDDRAAGGAAFHTVRAMRRDGDTAHSAVVLVSSDDDPATATRAAAAGVDDVVPAGVAAAALATVARNRLERGRALRQAGDLDPATRLPQLRAALPTAERMIGIARRYHHALAVLVAEVDHLRAIAAAHDDDTAERLAALLGRRLGRAFRNEDVVAHVAPGRFLVVAFGMKADDGVQRMAELLEGFRDQAVEGPEREPVRASFSAGIAQLRADGADAAALLRAAETALATAQRLGGDRVEAASHPEAVRVDWSADAIIVDADAPFAALVGHALETRGHRVRTIGDGREALDALTHPDAPVRARLLILELGLPGLDGLTLLRQLAEAGVLKLSKVVVVTTRSVEAEMIKAMELGAVDYITKPVSLPVLMRRLRSALTGAPGVG